MTDPMLTAKLARDLLTSGIVELETHLVRVHRPHARLHMTASELRQARNTLLAARDRLDEHICPDGWRLAVLEDQG